MKDPAPDRVLGPDPRGEEDQEVPEQPGDVIDGHTEEGVDMYRVPGTLQGWRGEEDDEGDEEGEEGDGEAGDGDLTDGEAEADVDWVKAVSVVTPSSVTRIRTRWKSWNLHSR